MMQRLYFFLMMEDGKRTFQAVEDIYVNDKNRNVNQ